MINPKIYDHFTANCLNGDELKGNMLNAEYVLEYINQFYILKKDQGSETTQQ